MKQECVPKSSSVLKLGIGPDVQLILSKHQLKSRFLVFDADGCEVPQAGRELDATVSPVLG